jgi:hypothetical protein
MSPRDLVYVGHMLDTAKKAISKTQSLSRGAYDADENLRLALIHLVQASGTRMTHRPARRTDGAALVVESGTAR